jgi:hypothetical protein
MVFVQPNCFLSSGASVQASENVYNNVANSFPSPRLVLNHSPVVSSECNLSALLSDPRR